STPMLHAIYIDELFWALLRFLCGIGISGMRMCLESWLNDLTHPKARILTVTCYIMILIGMSAFGQMLIQFIEIESFEGFCYVALCFVFSIVCVGITKSPVPEVLPHHQLKSITFLARIAIPLMGCFTAGVINGPYWTYSSLFLLDRGFGLSASAWFMSGIICGAAFVQIPVGILAQRFGFLQTTTLLCIIGIFCCIWISFDLNLGLSALLVLGCLFGATNWPLYSLSVAEANKTLTPKDRVRVAGTLLMSYAVGSLTGSLIVSVITFAFGLSSFFIVMACAQILMIGVVLYPNPSRQTAAEKAMETNTAFDNKGGPIFFDTLDPDTIELSKAFR
ncbi:MAG: MFS transporter, partial [Pseudomonadota bacterium]